MNLQDELRGAASVHVWLTNDNGRINGKVLAVSDSGLLIRGKHDVTQGVMDQSRINERVTFVPYTSVVTVELR